MPSRLLSSNSSKKKVVRKTPPFMRWILIVVQFFVSPLVILVDSFRKGILDRIWLYLFFLFTTTVMILTGIGILVTEGPLLKTMQMMSTVTDNREVLAGDLQPIIRLINKYALQNNLDPNLVFAIIKAESNFQPKAVSVAGARGLMQVMPEIWRAYSGSACNGKHGNQFICHKGDCIFEPESNIKVGCQFFRILLDNYENRIDLALEAYNAGISNVKPGFEPKYKETQGYIAKIITFWQEFKLDAFAQQLKMSIQLQHGLKWLFGTAFLCWVILFWWAGRKLLVK